ncbi:MULTISPECIES: hypothetical protein [Bradyrhizobium]|uniref:Uncharacterized protein n=1 Tax=Bradyrhizobium septentrionale TaxID=1404411 RepID=A0A973VY22_9BRAD|nr:hypothetical protein [Bradyrhizobium septentrionale]QIG91056.1 hypothetical protein G6P99_40615 [Bradyrhizobium sp. 6(2017)]UGY12376.1 hypothetical protein HAP48_0027380 [Bradyrhizobium septentrionale]
MELPIGECERRLAGESPPVHRAIAAWDQLVDRLGTRYCLAYCRICECYPDGAIADGDPMSID